jgi:hypothetical protein
MAPSEHTDSTMTISVRFRKSMVSPSGPVHLTRIGEKLATAFT